MALNDKPNHAGGYDRNRTALIREACLETIFASLADWSQAS